jgi:hypothetical protein
MDFEIIYPDELYVTKDMEYVPPQTLEPQFIGFQCLGCGARHAQLNEVIDCQARLQTFYAMHRANAMEFQAA